VSEKIAQSAGAASDKQTFLLFAGLGDSRMAIPLDTLARLEEFPSPRWKCRVTSGSRQYRGQILPLVRLAVVLEEAPPPAAFSASAAHGGFRSSPSFGDASRWHLVRPGGGTNSRYCRSSRRCESKATRPAVLLYGGDRERVTELLDIPAILQIAGVSGRSFQKRLRKRRGLRISHGSTPHQWSAFYLDKLLFGRGTERTVQEVIRRRSRSGSAGRSGGRGLDQSARADRGRRVDLDAGRRGDGAARTAERAAL